MPTTKGAATKDVAAEMLEFQRKVREEIIKAGTNRRDYTREQQNETLAALGLEPIYPPQFVPVEITTTKRTVVRVDDCPDLDSARARVAGMGEAEIVAKLRNPGGYVGHRVLDADEADSADPLGWIFDEHAQCIEGRPRGREATAAVRAEADTFGICGAYSPGHVYSCSRGRSHPGRHIARFSGGICAPREEGIWERGTSYDGFEGYDAT